LKIIVTLDNNNGMMFNKRRQSQDIVIRNDIKNLTKKSILYMNEFSYKLYKDIDCGNIKVSNDFLNRCQDNDFCLVESEKLISYIDKIDTIIVYKWNREYPSDFKFDINLKDEKWTLIKKQEFKGNSHDKITKEIYRRKYSEEKIQRN